MLKQLTATLLTLTLLFSCSKNSPTHAGGGLDSLLATDRAASRMAADSGFSATLLSYADNGFVKLNHGEYPVVGKQAFREKLNGRAGTRDISWEPRDGAVAQSGDLGFTWGDWTYHGKDTTVYGNYITVWSKQADGTWKMRLDGGNETPGPPEGEE